MTIDTDNPSDSKISTDMGAGADAEPDTETAIPLVQPRIRFGTIVWGLLIFAAGTTLLTSIRTPGRREQLANWALSLTPSDSMLIMTIVVGTIILVLGLLAVIRSQQKRWSRR